MFYGNVFITHTFNDLGERGGEYEYEYEYEYEFYSDIGPQPLAEGERVHNTKCVHT